MSTTHIEIGALLEILSSVCTDLFFDQNGKTYAVISHGGHTKNVAVDSQAFDDLVLRIAVRRSGIAWILQATNWADSADERVAIFRLFDLLFATMGF